ncbi:triose-phosphate isomerase [Neorhizobium lilium]|uniref:Triosephosphate isomerase n=1 Tax=Neorhizobium lilium TaxID=2503024 RepID=A0A444LLM0_9HYPH|nr:triose-phosphate isomerase [Neorhizobium lilium]RWX81172.1 triose-phosphate isomerase [Neorhizobium lilium]
MRNLLAGNWKMNGLASSLAEIDMLKELTGSATCDIVVCPPFTLIEKAAEQVRGSHIAIGAQDCHSKPSGAFTSDISASMLCDVGARFVILGHSERRAVYHESNLTVARKAAAAHGAGLTSIICVGETRAERDDGVALDVVRRQLRGSLPATATGCNTALAYEPVWAIGTGLVPTLEQIDEIHQSLRHILVQELGEEGRAVRILYGGSVKSSNAASIFDVADVNGALVGGASLKASDFAEIISAAA